MNRVLYIASLIFLLTAAVCYAQKTQQNFTTKKDSVHDMTKLYNDELNNNLNQLMFFNKNFSLIFHNYFTAGASSGLPKSWANLKDIKVIADPLANVKKNLSGFLSLQFNSLPNYNLGLAGKYITYLKNAAALYIALLSIL